MAGSGGRAFESAIAAVLPEDRRRRGVPLAPFTTFRVGGPADYLIDVSTEAELTAVVAAAHAHGVPLTVLGGGSNLLVADAGVAGAVLRVRVSSIETTAAGRVRAGAGATINGLVRWTIGHGLAGLEAWAGTPGTVGGAIYGNAHFGGRNIGDLVVSVHALTADGEARTFDHDALEFGYDRSRFQRSHDVIVWAEFAVAPGHADALRATARASLAHRKRTQPLDTPSAGCVFQNPDPARDALPPGVPASAGALIDRAGLKGARVGGASISTTHANFFLNDHGATAAELRALIELAKRTVRDRFGVDLAEEVVSVGDF